MAWCAVDLEVIFLTNEVTEQTAFWRDFGPISASRGPREGPWREAAEGRRARAGTPRTPPGLPPRVGGAGGGVGGAAVTPAGAFRSLLQQ